MVVIVSRCSGFSNKQLTLSYEQISFYLSRKNPLKTNLHHLLDLSTLRAILFLLFDKLLLISTFLLVRHTTLRPLLAHQFLNHPPLFLLLSHTVRTLVLLELIEKLLPLSPVKVT